MRARVPPPDTGQARAHEANSALAEAALARKVLGVPSSWNECSYFVAVAACTKRGQLVSFAVRSHVK